MYDHVDGSILLSFSCSSLACGSFWLQKCRSTIGAATSLCGPMVTHQRTGKSAESLSSKELLRTSHLRARCGPLYSQVSSFELHPPSLNFKHVMICVLCCNARIHVITRISSHVCDVLCVNASVLATCKDPS
jgi:hypothetical protein